MATPRKRSIARERRMEYYPKDIGTTTLMRGMAIRLGGVSAAIGMIVSNYISTLPEKEKEEYKKIGSRYKKKIL